MSVRNTVNSAQVRRTGLLKIRDIDEMITHNIEVKKKRRRKETKKEDRSRK